MRIIYSRLLAIFSKIYVARSQLAKPLSRLGPLRPFLSCDVASFVPRQLAKVASKLGLRLGTRRFFPPQCTCSLRCARAPLGDAQGLFYKQETIHRPRANANGISRNFTELNGTKRSWNGNQKKETRYNRRIREHAPCLSDIQRGKTFEQRQ